MNIINLQTTKPQWFALHTVARHEKKVSLHLRDQQIESFLPLHQSLRSWKNRTQVTVQLPLFPSYVFVRISPHLKSTVLAVPGALSVVGSKREPWPLPDAQMEVLRNGLDQCKPELYPYLSIGDRVSITDGPLAGMEGIFIEKKNGSRVILTIQQILRSVSVEVDIQHLQFIEHGVRRAC